MPSCFGPEGQQQFETTRAEARSGYEIVNPATARQLSSDPTRAYPIYSSSGRAWVNLGDGLTLTAEEHRTMIYGISLWMIWIGKYSGHV
jgi:hypothetical protein